MAKCGYCGSTIIMGGVKSAEQVYCNKKCFMDASILNVLDAMPSEVLDQKIDEVWRGNCPECGGAGPTDLHKSHQVWSALIMTRWSTKPRICCKSCATKRQLAGIFSSLLVGWWGFPWGLIFTPVQITRNIVGICGGPDKSRPSEGLRKAILVNLGRQLAATQQAAASQIPPIPAELTGGTRQLPGA